MRFFQRQGTGAKRPVAPGREPVSPKDNGKTAHVVSDDGSYVQGQIDQVVASFQPFNASPVCPKCASTAVATEHGNGYYVPHHPDAEQTEDAIGFSGAEWSYTIPAPGIYYTGPEYLVRSCTVCKYAWAEHTAEAEDES